MAAFSYTALNSQAQKQKGVIEAENIKMARQLLRNKNLTVMEIYPTQQKKYAISVKELTLMTRQLATLVSAGLPLEEALVAVSEQTEKSSVKSLILSVRGKVLEGHSLAFALREYPQAFSELYCSTIAAGEKSGYLDKVLEQLSDYTEQQFAIRQKIQQALIYPIIMILVSFGIVGFLLEYVVPKMIAVYRDTEQSLPWMTQGLIALSSGIKSDGIFILLFLIAAIFLFRRSLKTRPHFREKFHFFLLKIPILGNAIEIINTARFSRTFAILSKAGVSVLDAMTIASQLIVNVPIQKAVTEAVSRVREGAAIHLALKQTHFFPPMSLHLIASGESSGQLEPMLEHAANNQDNEISRLIDTSLALFEPLLILVMGALVLFIVLSVLLPIFQLNQLMG